MLKINNKTKYLNGIYSFDNELSVCRLGSIIKHTSKLWLSNKSVEFLIMINDYIISVNNFCKCQKIYIQKSIQLYFKIAYYFTLIIQDSVHVLVGEIKILCS